MPTPTTTPQARADNPLLAHAEWPDFSAITPAHVEPAIEALVEQTRADLARIEADAAAAGAGLLGELECLGDRLGVAWGAVGHLMGVRNSDALREAHAACQPKVVEVSLAVAQSRPIYEAFVALRDGPAWKELDETGRRVVLCGIRDAELSGVGLHGEDKARFAAIRKELAELCTAFSNRVLDATKAFALTLRDPEQVEGLPDSLLLLAASAARARGHEGASAEDGPWCITLDLPSFGPFLKYSARRPLREKLYRAHVTRATEGKLDNGPTVRRVLELRQQMAELLGFRDYAALSIAGKMAPGVEAVERLMEELRLASWPAAKADLEALRALAAEAGAEEAEDLRQWDVAFWAERLRQSLYGIDEEALRPYFPLPRVLSGLFSLVHRLFGVRIEAADGQAPVWHEDVRFFRLRSEAGQPLAAFYLDPYSRPADKRGGAWMDECVGRGATLGLDGGLRLPVAHLVCNSTPPVGDRPSLMTFREVQTLTHELGHGLQHMLSTVDSAHASGIRNVEWDAVELPSQFMENWCTHRPTVEAMSGHWQTGEPLPRADFDKLKAARTFRAGSDMLRQLHFSMTDLALHRLRAPGDDRTPEEIRAAIGEKTLLLPLLPEDRMLNAFLHVFGGGYAAGYYSYKWAEVLSADAFGAFEEAGLDDEEAVTRTGRRFRDTVLALGGSRHPMEVFRAFRGRDPSTEALLRHAGLR